MTPIEKAVSRSCPGIKNGDGRELQVRLHDEEGGTVSLKWKGLRQDAEIDVSLAELMDYAENGVPGVEAPDPETKEASPGRNTTPGEASPGRNTTAGEASPGRGTDTPKGIDKSEWIKFEDLLSRIHIIGDLDMATRLVLITTVKELRAHHAWLLSGATGSWETFKANHLATHE